MAQTGYTPISIYYSSTSTNVPTSGNLVAGELAINTADGKLFYKDSAGVVQVIGTKGGVGSSTTTQVLYNSSGLVVGSANMTFNGTTLTLANDASISGLTVGKGGGASFYNTAVGAGVLAANTTGIINTAVGSTNGSNATLSSNTTGNGNNAFGAAALGKNTTANQNNAFGYEALRENTTGANNVAVGGGALTANTTASNNTAVGYQAGYSQTAAGANTYMGYQAGYTNNGGSYNTLIGRQAGYTLSANHNTLIGDSSGYSLTTGTGNTFIGNFSAVGSGYYVTTGSKNTIIGGYGGNQGGLDIRTASNYIVLSDGDGNPRVYVTNTGQFNQYANATSDTSVNFVNTASTSPFGITMGFTAAAPNNTTQYFLKCYDTGNNRLYIYSNGTVSNATGTYNTISDVKLKENIVDATSKLDKLMDVKVRNYNLIGDELKQIGFVAQELEQVFPTLIDNVPDLDENNQPTGEITKGVKLTVMIPILVKAIQELKAEVDSLKQQLEAK